MNLWQRLDPRRHLGAAIGWAVFVVVTLFAVGAGGFAAAAAQSRVRADSERLLAQLASGIGHSLASSLQTRRQIVFATAAQIAASGGLDQPALRRQLEQVRRLFPEFEWLVVANAQGRLVAATDEPQPDQDVSARRWFRQANQPPSDPATRAPPPPLLPPPATGPRLPAALSVEAIELGAPIEGGGARGVAVLGAAVGWRWIDRLQRELLAALDQRQLGLQLLLVDGDGTVLSGPGPWHGRRLARAADLSEGDAFLVGRAAAIEAADGGPSWTVIVRQQAGAVLARARSVGHTVFLSVLAAGLLSAAIAVWFVRMLIGRLTRLAEQAQAIQRGSQRQLSVAPGSDEVSRIGAVLADLVRQLQQEKQSLDRLNTELDQRVAERTARIERMVDEMRHAAVTRERLRLARDLHDTLAQSMMALLTQIRLVRKLRARWSEPELEQELERAEALAASALTGARAAINQIRHNGVRDTGLGPALQELVTRFRERTGLGASLQVEPSAGELADERAETAFRIVEEALHNVEHHAQATAVVVQLAAIVPAGAPGRAPPQRVRFEVADDGVGFEPAQCAPPGHYGLRGMHEQAALIGARLEVLSEPGQGTRVQFEFDV